MFGDMHSEVKGVLERKLLNTSKSTSFWHIVINAATWTDTLHGCKLKDILLEKRQC